MRFTIEEAKSINDAGTRRMIGKLVAEISKLKKELKKIRRHNATWNYESKR